jgi:hypothetical protein
MQDFSPPIRSRACPQLGWGTCFARNETVLGLFSTESNMVTILDYNEFKKKALSNPKVKAEYDALESEFAHFDELLKIGKSHTSENR